jgi:hypothetical protein
VGPEAAGLESEPSLATGVSGKTPPGSSQSRATAATPQSSRKSTTATPPGSAAKAVASGTTTTTATEGFGVEVDDGGDKPSIPFPPPPPPRGHLQELEVSLFVQQQLSTYKLSDAERVDPDSDVLTGCHVIDSKWRMIILEGLHWGAMSLVRHRRSQCIYFVLTQSMFYNFPHLFSFIDSLQATLILIFFDQVHTSLSYSPA